MKYNFDGAFYPNINFGYFTSNEGPNVEILVDPSAVPPNQEILIKQEKNGDCKVFINNKITPNLVRKVIAKINGFKPEEIEVYESGNFIPF